MLEWAYNWVFLTLGGTLTQQHENENGLVLFKFLNCIKKIKIRKQKTHKDDLSLQDQSQKNKRDNDYQATKRASLPRSEHHIDEKINPPQIHLCCTSPGQAYLREE